MFGGAAGDIPRHPSQLYEAVLEGIVIFVVLSVIGLAINDALMWAGTELASFDYRLVKIVATAVVMVWNFVTRKIFLERRE